MGVIDRVKNDAALVLGLLLATERGAGRAFTESELNALLRTLHIAETRLQHLQRQYDRLALCPDHRDKATGRCVVCQAEDRAKQEERERWTRKEAF